MLLLTNNQISQHLQFINTTRLFYCLLVILTPECCYVNTSKSRWYIWVTCYNITFSLILILV